MIMYGLNCNANNPTAMNAIAEGCSYAHPAAPATKVPALSGCDTTPYAIKIAALKQKAAEEAKAKAKKAKPRFQSDENAIRNSSSNSSSRDDLGDITRCMSLPTPDARVKCVDGNQAKYY